MLLPLAWALSSLLGVRILWGRKMGGWRGVMGEGCVREGECGGHLRMAGGLVEAWRGAEKGEKAQQKIRVKELEDRILRKQNILHSLSYSVCL